jgi:radical SAM-linked protein
MEQSFDVTESDAITEKIEEEIQQQVDTGSDLDATGERQRVRLTYEKGEAIKFISHQDEFRMWERTLRRADLPLLYKKGFNPQPHIQFASPLGVGITGVAEPIDVIFSPPVPMDALEARIRAKLPPGVQLHGITELPLKAPSLHAQLLGADYTIIIYATPDEINVEWLHGVIERFLATPEMLRERQRKGRAYTYNLRPLVVELSYSGYFPAAEEHHIFLRVHQLPGATGRPDEVVAVLGLNQFARTLRRERLYFSDNAEDLECFAAYPAPTPTILPSAGRKRNYRTSKQGNQPQQSKEQGRTISERAADEFV